MSVAIVCGAQEPPPEYPERWISVWRNGTGGSFVDRDALMAAIDALDPRHEDILGILHLYPDGTTSMEQP